VYLLVYISEGTTKGVEMLGYLSYLLVRTHCFSKSISVILEVLPLLFRKMFYAPDLPVMITILG
jgi:hypothetical protein